jgi:thioredoxin reductase (NADPH)
MFTLDELRAIPAFADLEDKELEYLAKTSADLRLLPGEYVVHEGETRRALYVLVEGRIELTKFIDGEERVVGTERGPGEVFGELPVVLHTPSLVSFRTLRQSRVMRIEDKDFHVVADASPSFAAAMESAARDRVDGLQELANLPRQARLAVIGPQFDVATYSMRDFLQRNSIEFDWLTPQDAATSDSPPLPEPGHYPIVRLRDGAMLENPSIRDVAKAIDLRVTPGRDTYDLAIVGGGPAGLAAAVYGASEGLTTILLEREAPGGQAGTSSRIENYLGFPYGISGDELATRALQQAKRLGADIVVTRQVTAIDAAARALGLDGDVLVGARSIVVATGVSWRRLDIPALDRLRDCGVYYGAAPGEARYVQGQNIYLVGGGNSAGQAALNFSNYADSVTILVRGESLAKSMSYYLIEQLKAKSNIIVETCSRIVDAHGDECLETITVANSATGKTTRRATSSLFILIGATAETAWLPPTIERNPQGYILTGPGAKQAAKWPVERDPFLLETTVPGIFAVGDVRASSVKRVAAGVGEGSMVISFVHQYLAQASPLPAG